MEGWDSNAIRTALSYMEHGQGIELADQQAPCKATGPDYETNADSVSPSLSQQRLLEGNTDYAP